MTSLAKTALTYVATLLFSLNPSRIKHHYVSEKLSPAVEYAPFPFAKAASIDLGNSADQAVLADYCTKHNIPISCYRSFDFIVPKETDRKKIEEAALGHSPRLDKIVEEADIVHFSGHHEVGVPYFFAGSLVDSLYRVNSAIAFKDLKVHEETDLVFLTSCFSVNALNDFTRGLIDKFPNAVFFGYRLKSSDLSGNKKMMEGFLGRMAQCCAKEEFARLWIETGNEVYVEFPRRDFRALWKEGNVVYEVNRFSPNLEAWDFSAFTQK